jgi:SAM-dependent methyltransferase
MLIPITDFSEILISPKNKSKLYRKDNFFYSKYFDDECYKIEGEIPILIDFENSILNEEDFCSKNSDSPVSRELERNRFKKIFSFFVDSEPLVTKTNVKYILNKVNKSSNPLILIIGGGTIGNEMHPFYNEDFIKTISFDIYNSKNIQIIADAHNIPILDSTIDVVIIQAVLEHVLEPLVVVGEIYRVLKKGGLVYSETPFLQQVHEGPYDFTRFTESGHRYLFRKFELIGSGFVQGVSIQLLWTIEFFFRSLFRSVLVGKIFKLLFFWVRYFDFIIPKKYSIDSASGVFFLGTKSSKEIEKKQMVSYYQGAQK